MTSAETFLLRMTGIEKSYPGVRALKGVDFDLRPGEIHCLIGENGAGKSTLIRILSGAEKPNSGTIEMGDRVYRSIDPRLSHSMGIGVIYQELDLILPLTVSENICLGHEPVRWGFLLARREIHRLATEVMGRFDFRFPSGLRVRSLGPAQRQLVQIAKSLSRQIRILVLDEPTAALTDNEIDHLFALLERFRSEGIGIIYVSHRLKEVMRMADRVTVMRDGVRVGTQPVDAVDEDGLIQQMVGRSLKARANVRSEVHSEVVLSVNGLTIDGQFEDISFELHKGEVLGLGGLIGAGRSELLECLFGITTPDGGQILRNGKEVRLSSPRAAIQQGLALVPEERRESGLVLGRSVQENIIFPVLDRICAAGIVNRGKLRAIARDFVERLGIKTPSLKQSARTLSGGNQQKIVIAKWLAANCEVLLLDEPTRGIDVNAKVEIYNLVSALVAKGVSVIVATSELPELLMLTDRILVLAEGKLTKELISSQTDQVEIMRYAVPRSGKIGSRNLSDPSHRFEDQGTNRSTTKGWEWGNRWSSIGRFALENDAFVVLLCFFIGASLFAHDFLTWLNLGNLLSQSAMLGILSIGQFLVVVVGGFDLSVAAVMAFSSVLIARYAGTNLGLAVSLALIASLACGLVNGLSVTKGRVQPLIATLAMMGVARGLAFTVSEKGLLVSNSLLAHFSSPSGGLSAPTLIWFFLVAVFWLLLRQTRFGLHVYAIGGGETTSHLAGINETRIKLTIYALSGLVSGIAGLVLVLRTTSGAPTVGTGWELDTIAAIVIGGTRLFGGEGSLLKAMAGVLIYQIIANFMNLTGLDPFYQSIVRALLIIFAVGLGILREMQTERRTVHR
jgi:ABC-type sugar transport system ATPase subunit/ribose/xylose/arabinose/galactoside ABC-type transport system permease subunit